MPQKYETVGSISDDLATAPTSTSAALKRFSWTTFEDLIDCLSTVHQRLWVLVNSMATERSLSDTLLLLACKEAIGTSVGDSEQERVLDSLRVLQHSQATEWRRRVEEMEVAICAAGPIVVELEACARLWSRGALPPANHATASSTAPQSSPTPRKVPDPCSSPNAGNLLAAEDSTGFSRSEASRASVSPRGGPGAQTPPSIQVRHPSSATLIHPTSFRHGNTATMDIGSVSQNNSDARGYARHRVEGASDRTSHLVDLEDSLIILAVESERVTPAESSRRDFASPRDITAFGSSTSGVNDGKYYSHAAALPSPNAHTTTAQQQEKRYEGGHMSVEGFNASNRTDVLFTAAPHSSVAPLSSSTGVVDALPRFSSKRNQTIVDDAALSSPKMVGSPEMDYGESTVTMRSLDKRAPSARNVGDYSIGSSRSGEERSAATQLYSFSSPPYVARDAAWTSPPPTAFSYVLYQRQQGTDTSLESIPSAAELLSQRRQSRRQA
jgi:hypothetical protein